MINTENHRIETESERNADVHAASQLADAPKGRPASDSSAASRKLALLRRTGLFGSDLKGATVERAAAYDDLRMAYALVHQVYVDSGYIAAVPCGMRLRIFETSSDTATFVAKVDGKVVGVISVVGDSVDMGLPSDHAFRAELDGLRAQGLRLCEVTNQVVAEEYRRSAVTTELMRCAVAHSLDAGYQLGIATVSPGHNGFYDLLGFTQVGSERSYSEKIYDPVIALAIDFDHYRRPPEGLCAAADFVHQFLGPQNPYQECIHVWDRRARAHFLNPELLERLFVLESDFLAECTSAELGTIRMRWGQELFRSVIGTLPVDDLAETTAPFEDTTVEPASPFYSGSLAPFAPQARTSDRERFEIQLHSAREMTLRYVPELLPESRTHRIAAWWMRIRPAGAVLPDRDYASGN